ncbi:FIST N-terminal domain-containing protein [Acidithiobacillus sp. M4-SHS-6]|uniref:FIST signal transduction protein n=1 Tax=Acidithiobacillus sp. M4-SHS-6 TaxID=3383024 RepID=UPI0039BDA6BF
MHNFKRPFAYGHASDPDWRVALAGALEMVGNQARTGTLGFLYVSDLLENAFPDLLMELKQRLDVQHWIGCVGMGICATGQEYLDQPALALMVTDIPESELAVFSSMASFVSSPPLQVGTKVPFFAVVHADTSTPDLPDLVRDLASKTQSGFITGGLSSTRGKGVQVADKLVHGGLSGVAFSEKVSIVTRLSQGCSPIGPLHVIGDAKSNIVGTLDKRPALDVLYEEVGEILARDLQKAAGFIFVALPVKNDDRGDYTVRNLIAVDTDRKLMAIGEYIESGQSLMFCKRDGGTAREDLLRMLDELGKLVAGRPIRGGLYFSCLGRGEGLFGPDSAELRLIESRLGHFPLVGFFANGEISHDKIYGYTGVLTLFLDD